MPHAALILGMHLAHRESGAARVAHFATLAERGGVSQSVGRGRPIDMATRAGRSYRLHRVNGTLRIDYGIQSSGEILFAAAGVAHGAVSPVSGRSRRAQRRVSHVRKIVMRAAETD